MSKKITAQTSIQELLALVSEHLTTNKISTVLTGGAVVSIYTDNKYESKDLDFISPHEHKELLEVMAKIDFTPDPGGHKNLKHPKCPITIEFPARVVILGGRSERVDHTEEVHGVKVRMLSPTQSVMDRLAAFIGWNDPQGLDQAVWICEQQPVNFEKVKKWAKGEGASTDQLERIETRCKAAIQKYLSTRQK